MEQIVALPERPTRALAESLITLACHSDEHGKLVVAIADPQMFEGELHVIAERVWEYWHRHQEAPKVHTDDLFADILEDPLNRRRETFRRILLQMLQLQEAGINTPYIIGQLQTHTRAHALKESILRSAEILNQAQPTSIAEVEGILHDVLRARNLYFEPGVRLTDIDTVVEFMASQAVEFDTGIKPLDDRGIVPARGTVFLLLAAKGRGKTWGLIHIGKRGLIRRKKVFYISLEMAAELIIARFYQSLFAVPRRSGEVKLSRFDIRRASGIAAQAAASAAGQSPRDIVRVIREAVYPVFNLASPVLREELENRIEQMGVRASNLVVKRYPSRMFTPELLDAELDKLEQIDGFIPDLVLLDYIGITKIDMRNPRLSLLHNAEQFRDIMVERNMAGATAHQVSKAGSEALIVKPQHVAEAWALVWTMDVNVTMSQTSAEQRVGLARLYVGNARNEGDNFSVLITQSYATGQFALDAIGMPPNYYDIIDSITGTVPEDTEPETDDEQD